MMMTMTTMTMMTHQGEVCIKY